MGHNSACHMVYEVQEQQRKRNLNLFPPKKAKVIAKKKVCAVLRLEINYY